MAIIQYNGTGLPGETKPGSSIDAAIYLQNNARTILPTDPNSCNNFSLSNGLKVKVDLYVNGNLHDTRTNCITGGGGKKTYPFSYDMPSSASGTYNFEYDIYFAGTGKKIMSKSVSVNISSGSITLDKASMNKSSISKGDSTTFTAYVSNSRTTSYSGVVQFVVGGYTVANPRFHIPANTQNYPVSATKSWNDISSNAGTGRGKYTVARFAPYLSIGQQVYHIGSLDVNKAVSQVSPGGNVKLKTFGVTNTDVSSGGSTTYNIDVDNTTSSSQNVSLDIGIGDYKVYTASKSIPANKTTTVSVNVPYDVLSKYQTGSLSSYVVLESGSSWGTQRLSGPTVTIEKKPSSGGGSTQQPLQNTNLSFDVSPSVSKANIHFTISNPNAYQVKTTYSIDVWASESKSKSLGSKTTTRYISANGSYSNTITVSVNNIPSGGSTTTYICMEHKNTTKA